MSVSAGQWPEERDGHEKGIFMDASQKFINRELGWLSFNEQVLEEALDPEVPLLERLRFLSIVANNLDEFFMVRVAELKRQEAEGDRERCPAGMTAEEQLAAISVRAHALVERTIECAMKDVLSNLARQGIRLYAWEELTEAQRSHLTRLFHERFFPVLTPLAIDPAHPFPILQNLRLNLGVLLDPKEGEAEPRLAIVQLPAAIPRLIDLPGYQTHAYLCLEEILRHHLTPLFPAQNILDVAAFRITRDSELDFDGDAPSFLAAVESELRKRRTNHPVRLEVEASIRPQFLAILQARIGLGDPDVYRIPGPLDLSAFFQLADLSGFDALHYEPFPPQPVPELEDSEDLWTAIRTQDILLHHPYETFDPVTELLKTAARDPNVLAIKQTLYRTSRNSPIIEALTEAARNGKQVCVVVELMARFDEERNIEGARRLEEAGAHVIWGIVGLKTHAKICLVVRREPEGVRRYVHLSTGNYNERTARLYTDLGLLTADERFGQDASNFFNALTGYSDVPAFHHFAMAPYNLRERLLGLVKRETRWAKDGPASMTLKMNSLVDDDLIEALYEASQAGVKIRMNVRGICCLRPGIPGLSENIEVVSIIDRFLEHARIYHFHNGGEDEVYLASADWMPRNLDRRIELLFPVRDGRLKQKLLENLEVYFRDNRNGRVLMPDGTYRRRQPGPGEPVTRCQVAFHQAAIEQRRRRARRPPLQLVPRSQS
ncbi:MAG: polyphosphate kinase 1 [Armatimonadetes bacterium]|nr:polyphosphate kinase 1 [Planctomycetota bacterium]MBI2200403.1 polyphosphate kinase 1 [Armatimonadota bacterium]